jgi:hypothetical protein
MLLCIVGGFNALDIIRGLAVVPTNERDDEYRRVGSFYSRDFPAHDLWDKKTVVLV